MPKALATFAALCLLAALAYAFWPDGTGHGMGGGEDPAVAGAGSGASGGAASSGRGASGRTDPRAGGAGTGAAGTAAGAGEKDPEPDGTIRVEVQAQGSPLAGARVRIYRRGIRDPNTNRVGWTPMGSSKTGKDGATSFLAGPGRYVAVAEADRLGRASKVVVRAAGDAVTKVVLALSEARVLNGRVQVKRTREPVPLADVAVVPADPDAESALEEMPPEERLTMRADEKGAFRFKGLGSSAYTVIASAPGYGRDEQDVKLPHAEDVVLELAPAGVLEGYVLGSDGKPSVGAEVMVAGADEPISVPSGMGGGFSIEVPPGSYRLSARKGAEAGALPSPVVVAARTTARGLVLKMGKAAGISGDVVRKKGGDPVAGATVDVSPYLAAGDSGRAVTDGQGRFSVNGLAPGAYDVVVRGAGISEVLERGITVANGEQYTLHVEVSGTAEIAGAVTDGAGQPVRGAVVTAIGPLDDAPSASASTDEEGNYRITGVPTGRVEIAASRSEGGYQPRISLQLTEDDVGRADFTLPDTSVVEGRVVAKAGGAPRIQVSVRLYQTSKRRSEDAEVNDDDGTFRAEVPPDEYRVIAFESTGMQRGPLAATTVKVEPGKVARVELVVDDSAPVAGSSVLVLEPTGVPSPGAQVWATKGGRPMRTFRTDETGHASLTGMGMKGGDSLVLKAWNGGRAGEAPYTPGGGDITLTLRPAASLHGRVVGGGAPVAGFTLDVEAAEWHPGGTGLLSFPGNQFQVTDLAPENVTVKVLTSDGRKGSATATLTSGASTEVVVSLDPSTQVRARVVTTGGGALRGVQVFSGEEERELGRSGPDGRVSLTSLATGQYVLHFEAEGYLPTERRVEVRTGQAVDLGDVVLNRNEGG